MKTVRPPSANRAALPILVAAFLFANTPALAAAAPAGSAPVRPPNILFILADDLGYGDLGSYGQQRIQTPNLDRLAAEGMRFTQFYAGSTVCAPSRCVLMTGFHVGHATIRGNAKINLGPEDTTVAEVLKTAGYTTGLIGKWGLGSEGSDGTPTRKGFDYFYGYVDQTMAHNYYPHYLVRNDVREPLRNVVPNPGPFGQGVATVRVDYSADLLAEDALRFIRENSDRPFFLYFSPTLPHANNENRPDGMEVPDYGIYTNEIWPNPSKGYAAMVTRLDAHVGRILDQLRESGIADNTVVFFTSDNGPHREGGNNPDFFNSSGLLRGIKRDLTEGGIRVPLIVRWPGRVAAGSISSHIASFADFLPTAAAFAGAPPPPSIDGVSFLPELTGEAQQSHDHLYWEFYEQFSAQAVRRGQWKALRSPMLTGPIRLYDLDADPGEQRDIASERPEIVAELAAVMDRAHVPSPLWIVPGTAPAPNVANP
jgi:arylsulfatase A-like enzyme